MSLLSNAVPISELNHSSLWVVYGKSGAGKTQVGSTFPKPMLYIRVGDDGSNTIKEVEGIDAIVVSTPDELKNIVKELCSVKRMKYATVLVDTFSLYVNVWVDVNVLSKSRKMTQQAWGDLKCDTEELIRMFHALSTRTIVVLTCHEITDSIEGMEEELLPDVGPSVSKGSRLYLQSMANFAIHCTKLVKSIEGKEVVKFVAHVGPNPYYWTKFQVSKDIKLPKLMINPSYEKIQNLLGGN